MPDRTREDQTPRIVLILLFLGVLFLEGTTRIGIDLFRGERPQPFDLLFRAPSEENLRTYEEDLEEGSWIVRGLRPVMQSLRAHLWDDFGSKAVRGREGWWFYDLDVKHLTDRPPLAESGDPVEEEMVSAVLSFRDRLAERGIRLLLVPAPGKPSIHPDRLTRRADSSSGPVNPHTLQILDRLAQEGVEVMNLFEVFRSRSNAEGSIPLYLKQDTHWSPAGMRLAAEAVGDRLVDLGWAEEGSVVYDLEESVFTRHGDVLRMTRVPGIENRFDPEEIRGSRVIDPKTGGAYSDDPQSDILVLGDSFLRIYERDEPGSGGFVAHLARRLRKPLASIVNDGGASTLVRQELYRKPELLAGKKVVVWEFVERDIRFGTEGWKDVPLPEEKRETES